MDLQHHRFMNNMPPYWAFKENTAEKKSRETMPLSKAAEFRKRGSSRRMSAEEKLRFDELLAQLSPNSPSLAATPIPGQMLISTGDDRPAIKLSSIDMLNGMAAFKIYDLTSQEILALKVTRAEYDSLPKNKQDALQSAFRKMLSTPDYKKLWDMDPNTVALFGVVGYDRDKVPEFNRGALGRIQVFSLNKYSAADIEKLTTHPDMLLQLDMAKVKSLTTEQQTALKKAMKESAKHLLPEEFPLIPPDTLNWLSFSDDELNGFKKLYGKEKPLREAVLKAKKLENVPENGSFMTDRDRVATVLSLLQQYEAAQSKNPGSAYSSKYLPSGTVTAEGYVGNYKKLTFTDNDRNVILKDALVGRGPNGETVLVVNGKCYGLDGKVVEAPKPDNDLALAISLSKSYHRENVQTLIKDLNKRNRYGTRVADLVHLLQGQDLTGLDLSNADFSGVDLSKLNLKGVKLKEASFRGAQFKGANLEGVDFEDAYLGGALLDGAKFKGASLAGAKFLGFDRSPVPGKETTFLKTDFKGADLTGVILTAKKLRSTGNPYLSEMVYTPVGTDFQDAKLGGAVLTGLDFSNCSFRTADLNGADFDKTTFGTVKLYGADFNGSKLAGANLKGARFGGAKLKGANLDKVDFNGALMATTDFNYGSSVDLRGADLKGAKLAGGNWSGVEFKQVKLQGADLNGTDFNRAWFEDCDLTDVSFKGVKMKGIYFSHVKPPQKGAKFGGADFDGAVIDYKLEGVDIEGAVFKGAVFKGGAPANTTFKGNQLNGATFEGASFSGAKLIDVKLSLINWKGADLSRADLSKSESGLDGRANLDDLDFSDKSGPWYHTSLAELNLDGKSMKRANINRRGYPGLKLSKTDMTEVSAQESNLSGGTFNAVIMNRLNRNRGENAPPPKTNFTGAAFNLASVKDADLREANLTSVIGVSVDFEGTDFSGAVLDQANFNSGIPPATKASRFVNTRFDKNSRLRGTGFMDCDLSGATFDQSQMAGVILNGSTLNGTRFINKADLTNAWLVGVKGNKDTDFTNATMVNAQLINAQLSEAKFNGADLKDSNLTNANVSGADFRSASLRRSVLAGTDLSNIQFDAQKTGANSQFLGALYDDNTKFPGINNADPAARKTFAEKYGLKPVHEWRAKYDGVGTMPGVPKNNDFKIQGTEIRMSDLPTIINANRGEANVLGLWQPGGLTKEHLTEALKRVNNLDYLRNLLRDQGADPEKVDEIIKEIRAQLTDLRRVLSQMKENFGSFDTNGDGVFNKADLKQLGENNKNNIYQSLDQLTDDDWNELRKDPQGLQLHKLYKNTPERLFKSFIPDKFVEMADPILTSYLGIEK